MNQKQRDYIVSELTIVRDRKIKEVTLKQDSLPKEEALAKMVKAAKEGELVEFSKKRYYNYYVFNVLNSAGMKVTIMHNTTEIGSSGHIKPLDRTGIVASIKKKHLMEDMSDSYFISFFRDWFKNADDILFGVSQEDIDNKIKAIREAYKEAERKVMLANSEELIQVIKDFEEREF